MELTFDKLPEAVGLLSAKLDRIEQLLNRQSQPAKADAEEILNLDETCKLLNLAKPTIYGLVSQRKLPYMKQGKKLYFSKQELTDWLKQGSKAVKDLDADVDKKLSGAKRGQR